MFCCTVRSYACVHLPAYLLSPTKKQESAMFNIIYNYRACVVLPPLLHYSAPAIVHLLATVLPEI